MSASEFDMACCKDDGKGAEKEEKEDVNLHSMLHKACKKYPHHTAVIYDDGCHGIEVATYREVLDGANLLTTFLTNCVHLGQSQEMIIGLFAEPSVSLPSCILG